MMGYRDDLIDRLAREGSWDRLAIEEQRRFEHLTNDQARQIMVMEDQWSLGEQEAVELIGLASLVQMIVLFRGSLVETAGDDAGKLSKAGRLLAEFFVELTEDGLSSDDVDAGLRKLSPLCIAALVTVYRRSVELSGE
ncbi:MAG: hypothetical protein HQ582_30990 [Planctomycetes bacterium]|nr:hypothetical protein [Planctomycetota bacterium]